MPCNLPIICHAGKILKKSRGLLEFASGSPLGGGLNENYGRPWNLIKSPSCRTLSRLFILEVFFEPLGLHLRVRSKLGWSPPFWLMRTLRLQWSWAFGLVCEVALNIRCSIHKLTNLGFPEIDPNSIFRPLTHASQGGKDNTCASTRAYTMCMTWHPLTLRFIYYKIEFKMNVTLNPSILIFTDIPMMLVATQAITTKWNRLESPIPKQGPIGNL